MFAKEYEFSVIIPSRNRRDTLGRVLRALEEQNFPKSLFEVIVIDDLSTDGTGPFLSEFQQKSTLNLLVITGTATTAGAARNLGLQQAGGKRILFLDADTIPQNNLLVLHTIWLDHFGENACILGYVGMSDELEKSSQGRINDTKTRYDQLQISELHWQDYRTANTSLARHKCLLAGGFDPKLVAAEDTEFASRLHAIGTRFIFVRDIQVVHHHPLSYDGYFQKGTLYGRAVAHWYKKAPEFRALLVHRYGVYAPEMMFWRKVKHRVRQLFVNPYTVPMLSLGGRYCRSKWFELSDKLYKCVFRYHVRQAFRASLRNV